MILCLVDGDPVSLEALTFARGLGEVEALVFEETDVDGYTTRARRVVHPRLGDYAPAAWAQAVIELEPQMRAHARRLIARATEGVRDRQ